jgi:type III secretion protein T
MTLPASLDSWVTYLRPQAVSWLLCATRFLPPAFLCPIFGGNATPTSVRLTLCLALAAHVRFSGGVEAVVPELLPDYVAAFGHEILVGFTIGFVAALPFDAARMGGRLLDTQRGANAEAMLPGIGSREAATGHLLHQILVALAYAAGAYKPIIAGLINSFRPIPLGVWSGWHGEGLAAAVISRGGGALAAGIAIGAPAAAVSLVVDAALGVAARVAPQIHLKEVGGPAKLMLGAAAILFSLGVICERLLGELDGAANAAVNIAASAFGK